MHEPGPKDADPREYRRRQFVLANMLAEFGQGGIVELVHIDANIWSRTRAAGTFRFTCRAWAPGR